MIKIGQIQGFYSSGDYIFQEKNIKKIGIQADSLKNISFIINNNTSSYKIGNTNMIQFDNLNEKISISFGNGNGENIFAIIDYEERIDE